MSDGINACVVPVGLSEAQRKQFNALAAEYGGDLQGLYHYRAQLLDNMTAFADEQNITVPENKPPSSNQGPALTAQQLERLTLAPESQSKMGFRALFSHVITDKLKLVDQATIEKYQATFDKLATILDVALGDDAIQNVATKLAALPKFSNFTEDSLGQLLPTNATAEQKKARGKSKSFDTLKDTVADVWGKTFADLVKINDKKPGINSIPSEVFGSTTALAQALTDLGMETKNAKFMAERYKQYAKWYALNAREGKIHGEKGPSGLSVVEKPGELLLPDSAEHRGFPPQVVFSMMAATLSYAAQKKDNEIFRSDYDMRSFMYGGSAEDLDILGVDHRELAGIGPSFDAARDSVGVKVAAMLGLSAKDVESSIYFENLQVVFGQAAIIAAQGNPKTGEGWMDLRTKIWNFLHDEVTLEKVNDTKRSFTHGRPYKHLHLKTSTSSNSDIDRISMWDTIDKKDAETALKDAEKNIAEGLNSFDGGLRLTPNPNVPKTISGVIGDVSPQVQSVIKSMQDAPHHISVAGVLGNLMYKTDAGRAGLELLDGIEEVDEATDIPDIFTRKNTSNTMKRVAMKRFFDAYAEKANKKLKEIYFSYSIMTSGRMQQTDDISPQQSHFLRHMITGEAPTEYTKENMYLFKMAVLFNLGYKVDKEAALNINKAYDAYVKHPVMMKAVRANLIKDDTARANAIAKLLPDLMSLKGQIIGVNPANVGKGDASILNGITGLTDIFKATGTLAHVPGADMVGFKSDIPLEIDGIANGTAIGLMQFPHFEPETLQMLLEMVGVRYHNEQAASAHLEGGVFIDENDSFKYVDVYTYFADQVKRETTVEKAQQYMEAKKDSKSAVRRMGNDPQYPLYGFAAINAALGRVYDDINDGRSFVKYPLMIVQFQGSIASVAGGAASDAIKDLYVAFNKLQKSQAKLDRDTFVEKREALFDDIQALGGFDDNWGDIHEIISTQGEFRNYLRDSNNLQDQARRHKRNRLTAILDQRGPERWEDLTEYRFNDRQLRKTITTVLEPRFYLAVQSVFGDAMEIREKVSRGVDLQHHAFMLLFEDRVAEIENGTEFVDAKGQLSNKERDQLLRDEFKELVPQMPTALGGMLDQSKRVSEDVTDAATEVSYEYLDAGTGKGKKITDSAKLRTFKGPGAAAIVGPIHNLDSGNLVLTMKQFPFLLPLHDALFGSPVSLLGGSQVYNPDFVTLNTEHSITAEVFKQTKKITEHLAELDKTTGSNYISRLSAAVDEKMHANTSAREKNDKNQGDPKSHGGEFPTYTAKEIYIDLKNAAETSETARKQLDNIDVADQMFIADAQHMTEQAEEFPVNRKKQSAIAAESRRVEILKEDLEDYGIRGKAQEFLLNMATRIGTVATANIFKKYTKESAYKFLQLSGKMRQGGDNTTKMIGEALKNIRADIEAIYVPAPVKGDRQATDLFETTAAYDAAVKQYAIDLQEFRDNPPAGTPSAIQILADVIKVGQDGIPTNKRTMTAVEQYRARFLVRNAKQYKDGGLDKHIQRIEAELELLEIKGLTFEMAAVVEAEDVATVNKELNILNSIDALGQATNQKTVFKEIVDASTINTLSDKFKSVSGRYYANAKQFADHSEHLQKVMGILATGIEAAGNIRLEESAGQGITHGSFERARRKVKVFVGARPYSPNSESPQEVYTHEMVHGITMAARRNNAVLSDNIERRFDQTKEELATLEDANGNRIPGWSVFIDGDHSQATAKEVEMAKVIYDNLFNNPRNERNILDEFLANATTNRHLIAYLQGTKPNLRVRSKTLFGSIMHLIDLAVQKLTEFRGTTKNSHEDMIATLEQLISVQNKHENVLSQLVSKTYANLDKVDEKIKEVGVKQAAKIMHADTVKGVKHTIKAATSAGTLLISDNAVTAKVSLLVQNKFSEVNWEAVAELGEGPLTPALTERLLGAKNLIGKARQEAERASIIWFNKIWKSTDGQKMKPAETIALTNVVLRTELSALLRVGMPHQKVMNLVRSTDAQIVVQQELLQKQLGITNSHPVTKHAKALGSKMAHENIDYHDGFQNGHAIALDHRPKSTEADVFLIEAIATLEALKQTNKDDKVIVDTLSKAEFAVDQKVNALIDILDYHASYADSAVEDLFKNNRTQRRHGYVVERVDNLTDIQMGTEADRPRMRAAGYMEEFKVSDIHGITSAKNIMYVSRSMPEITDKSGAISTTGLAHSGTTISEILARDPDYTDANGVLKHKEIADVVKRIKGKERKLARQGKRNKTQLDPLRDDQNNIVDYRIIMPNKDVHRLLKPELEFQNVMAHMQSSLVDKHQTIINDKLTIDVLVAEQQNMLAEYPGIFTDILDPQSRYHERYRKLPQEVREYMKQYVGKDGKFMVRKVVINKIFGYKAIDMSSAGIIAAEGMLPVRAAARLLHYSIKTSTSYVKSLYVLATPAVMLGNITSNIFQLHTIQRIPLSYVYAKFREGMVEYGRYRKDTEEHAALKLEMKAKGIDPTVSGKDADRLVVLEARILTNKLRPMAEKGMDTLMVEDVNTASSDGFLIRAQKLLINSKHVSKLDARIPTTLGRAANILFLTKGSEAGQATRKIVQVTDFMSRFIMMEYAQEVKGHSFHEAMHDAIPAFINFDENLPPWLDFVEGLNMTMFVSFYLRVQRTARKLVRENPTGVASAAAMQLATGAPALGPINPSWFGGKALPNLWNQEDSLDKIFGFPAIDAIADVIG